MFYILYYIHTDPWIKPASVNWEGLASGRLGRPTLTPCGPSFTCGLPCINHLDCGGLVARLCMTACGHVFSVLQRRVSASTEEQHHNVGMTTHRGEHKRGATKRGSGIHLRIVSKQDWDDLRVSVEAGSVKGPPSGLFFGVGICACLEQVLSLCHVAALRRVAKRLFHLLHQQR